MIFKDISISYRFPLSETQSGCIKDTKFRGHALFYDDKNRLNIDRAKFIEE